MKVPRIIVDSPLVLGTAGLCVTVYGLSLLHPSILSYFSWPSWRLSLSLWTFFYQRCRWRFFMTLAQGVVAIHMYDMTYIWSPVQNALVCAGDVSSCTARSLDICWLRQAESLATSSNACPLFGSCCLVCLDLWVRIIAWLYCIIPRLIYDSYIISYIHLICFAYLHHSTAHSIQK